jgi:hypothetical protein
MKQEELKKAEQELNEEVLNDVNGGGGFPATKHQKPEDAPGAPGNGFMPEIGDTSDSQAEYL